MGNASSALAAEKLEELINKHVYNVHAIGYNDVIGLNEYVYQLNHTQFYQIKSTSLIVAQKLFLKREESSKMDLISENFRYLNKTIPLSTHPYFLLSISITQLEKVKVGEALPVLSRQHLQSTLEERLSGGISIGHQQKVNLALQIMIAGAVLHDLNDSIAYLGDFAPYKPLYFAEGRLDEVTLFHPNILERCYLPPEKINNEKAALTYRYSTITKDEETLNSIKAMDIFSVGCILLELFVGDANPLFNYQKMISYRSGDKSALERINSVKDTNVREMITKMISIDPKERGSFREHLSVFSSLMPKEILDLYAFFNYALRRAEFSQPDNKLALIRMIAPMFIEATTSHLTEEDQSIIDDRFDGIVFHRCFPYHLSKVAILYQFKGIISSNPLGGYFSNENLVSFITKTIEQTEKSDYKIASANPSSTIYLDGVQYLQESTLNINQKPYADIDPYQDKANTNSITVAELFTEQLTKAKRSREQHKVLEKFTVMSSMIETICSLLRNLQLSQSYLLALELLENFSRFVRSEEVILHIFPHLQCQVEAQSNKIEKYYSIDLFCKLAKRIRYVPKTLAKSAAYSGYIRTMIDLCKGDPFLQNQIFKNIRSFIYLNILFSVLAIQSKFEEKQGKTDPDFLIDSANIEKVVQDIMSDVELKNFRVHFDYNFFSDLIINSYKDDTSAVELVRALPEIHVFFDIQTLFELVNETFQIYAKTTEPGFRNKAMKSIAYICPNLPEANVLRVMSRMKELVYTTWEYTETAALVEAFTYIVRHVKLDSLEVYKILICVKHFLVHPNNLILQKTKALIKYVYETAPREDIVQIVSPILLGFTNGERAYSYDIFDLVRAKPLSYSQFRKLLQKEQMSMNNEMSLIFDYVEKTFNLGKSGRSKMMLKQREFSVHRNVGSYIQEVLGSLILYQALMDYPEDKKKELNAILQRMGTQEDKRKEQKEEKDQLVSYISKRLLEHDDSLRIFPKWENKTDNYANLMSFKENFIDHIGVVRADYKFLKHFNMSVLKLCMNHIQMIVHQTKLKFVAENKVVTRQLDPEKVLRMKRWRPSGILLTSINSHEAEVKCLAAINDNTFVSGSQDGHVKYHSLPALSKNFIHNSVLDIDLNRGRSENDGKIHVNQLHHLKHINKLAVITNQNEIIICDEGKSSIATKLDSKSRVTAATVYDMDDFRSCIATVNTECDFLLWDLRKKEPAMQCNLTKIRGVPSSICRINKESTNMIATYKGYLISHDIRTNMALSTYRLIYDKKQIPIISVNQFVPHTKFKTLTDESGIITRENEDMLVALTYPSKCNQFSVFNAYPNSQLMRNPKLHFESGRLESETTRPTEVPMLEEVTQKEKILDINAFSNDQFEYFKDIVVNDRHKFCLGKAFKIRTVDSIVNLYTDIFHRPMLNIKEECLNNFTSVMQTLSAMGDCNMTINKLLFIPNTRVSRDIQIDNIILAAGTDKNIRFMNLGNEFENYNPMQEDFDAFNCYHLSNMDNMHRHFKYSYSHDLCLLKESVLASGPGTAGPTMDPIWDNSSQGSSRNGLSFYHNNFLSQRKTSDTLPGHSAAIKDMILMEHNEALLLVSCGDDGTIKVWL